MWTLKYLLTHIYFYLNMIEIYLIIISLFINCQSHKYIYLDKRWDQERNPILIIYLDCILNLDLHKLSDSLKTNLYQSISHAHACGIIICTFSSEIPYQTNLKNGSCFFPSTLCVSPAHLFSSSTNKIKLIRQIGGDFALQLKNTKIYSDLTDL